MSRTTKAAALALIVASAVVVTGCTATDAGGGETTDTINTVLSSDPRTFDPVKGAAIDDYTVSRFLFDSLLRRDSTGITGGLASTFTANSSSDYTFEIRDDATCADGTPLTATVVADSLTYLADPESGSTFRSLIFGTGGATISADDATSTVSIALTQPWSELFAGLTLAQSGIICPAGLADLEGLALGTVPDAFSGPYTLAGSNPGVGYEFELREDYTAWPDYAEAPSGDPATFVNFAVASDPSTIANQLTSGDLDVASLSDDNIDRFAETPGYEAVSTDGLGLYLVFNERETSVFADDQPLRAAVAQAIDREALNTAVTSGRGAMYSSIVSPEFSCVNEDESLLQEFDAAAAADVLEGVTVRVISSNAFGPNGAAGEYVQEALIAAGATVELRNTDGAGWVTNLLEPSGWDLTVYGDANQTGSLSASLSRLMGVPFEEGGRNVGAAVNPEGDAALAAAVAASDETAKCEAYQESQEAMLERVDVMPLFSISPTVIVREGFDISVLSGYFDPTTMRVNN